MKNTLFIFFSFFLATISFSQKSRDFIELIRFADQFNQEYAEDGSLRTFNDLPDSIRYNLYSGGSVFNSLKIIPSYDENGRISHMDVNNSWNTNRIRFKYDEQNRRTVADNYVLVNGDEIKQGYVYYHYDNEGRLDKSLLVDGGNILAADSVQIEYDNGKIIRYNRFDYNNNNHTWKSLLDIKQVQYEGEDIISYEVDQRMESTNKYLHFKNEDLKTLQHQTVNLFPELNSVYNYDTSYFENRIFSVKNAADNYLQHHAGQTVYLFDEDLQDYVLYLKSKIISDGQEAVVDLFNEESPDIPIAHLTYNFDNINRLEKVTNDNIINSNLSFNIFDYDEDGYLSQNVFLTGEGDSLNVEEMKYTYYDDGKLFSYRYKNRYNNFENSGVEYKFYYNTLHSQSIDDSGVDVFPNPASDILTIESDEDIREVEVLDINGKLITVPIFRNNQLNISKLLPGNYLVKMQTSNGIRFARFTRI